WLRRIRTDRRSPTRWAGRLREGIRWNRTGGPSSLRRARTRTSDPESSFRRSRMARRTGFAAAPGPGPPPQPTPPPPPRPKTTPAPSGPRSARMPSLPHDGHEYVFEGRRARAVVHAVRLELTVAKLPHALEPRLPAV